MTLLRVIVLCTTTLLLLACPPAAKKDPVAERAEGIVHMLPEERRRAISALRPEEQLDVYLYAYTKREPPTILAVEVADNWRAVLPVLKSRTASETNSRKLAGLMMIFATISYNDCSLADQQDVISITSEAVRKITPPFRKVAEEQLADIVHAAKQLPPCR